MRKLIILLLALALCLSFAGCGKAKDATADTDSSAGSSSTESSSDENKEEEKEEYKVNFDAWEMELIDSTHPLAEGFAPPLATIKSAYTSHPNTRFDARAIGRLIYMLEDADEAGVKLKIETAFKSENDQLSIFNAKVNEIMDSDITLTLKEAEDIAKTQVAFPRTSEHELGLAVDFSKDGSTFKETEEYKWLIENCYSYGFVPRYPDNPAHFRYVGVENAAAIKESGLSFNEYIKQFGNK